MSKSMNWSWGVRNATFCPQGAHLEKGGKRPAEKMQFGSPQQRLSQSDRLREVKDRGQTRSQWRWSWVLQNAQEFEWKTCQLVVKELVFLISKNITNQVFKLEQHKINLLWKENCEDERESCLGGEEKPGRGVGKSLLQVREGGDGLRSCQGNVRKKRSGIGFRSWGLA